MKVLRGVAVMALAGVVSLVPGFAFAWSNGVRGCNSFGDP